MQAYGIPLSGLDTSFVAMLLISSVVAARPGVLLVLHGLKWKKGGFLYSAYLCGYGHHTRHFMSLINWMVGLVHFCSLEAVSCIGHVEDLSGS